MSDAPVLLEELIKQALTTRASDIHIEPYPDEFRVRFRIDGLLQQAPFLERNTALAVIARIKVLTHLNIAQKRLPQDGSFSFTCADSSYDIRVATFPSLYGEKVVLRLLDRSSSGLTLSDLGFEPQMLADLKQITGSSDGFFLVTGPTGAGKTTTLHMVLSSLKTEEKNAVTLEDPVEYTIDGVTQTQVMPAIGLSFEKGLRALLRQDPDIIMVGEIRDQETAHVAIQAALTGHVVLSSLHTTDAPSALIRLIDMGIEPFLVSAAVKGILAQRLARRLCKECRYEDALTEEEQVALERRAITLIKNYRSAGCSSCRGTGYYGRIGIFQLLQVSSRLRALCTKRPDYDALCAQAYQEGMKPLIADAVSKVDAGIISVQELLRVLG